MDAYQNALLRLDAEDAVLALLVRLSREPKESTKVSYLLPLDRPIIGSDNKVFLGVDVDTTLPELLGIDETADDCSALLGRNLDVVVSE